MKKICCYLLLFLPHYLSAQTENVAIKDRLYAIKQEERAFFSLGIYAIFAETSSKAFTPKNVKKLQRKYDVSDTKISYKTNAVAADNIKTVEKAISDDKKDTTYTTLYFIKKGEAETEVIGFYSRNYIDTLIEKEFVNLYFEGKISERTFMANPVKTINMAGRYIELSPSCRWMNVNSIQCPSNGQFNWASHENLQQAEIAIQQQLQGTLSNGMGKLVSDEMTDIVFEDKPIKARKVQFKFKTPEIIMGGSNELIIYYVATEIRGQYISCVLSYYIDNRLMESGLPYLLDKVMKIKR